MNNKLLCVVLLLLWVIFYSGDACFGGELAVSLFKLAATSFVKHFDSGYKSNIHSCSKPSSVSSSENSQEFPVLQRLRKADKAARKKYLVLVAGVAPKIPGVSELGEAIGSLGSFCELHDPKEGYERIANGEFPFIDSHFKSAFMDEESLKQRALLLAKDPEEAMDTDTGLFADSLSVMQQEVCGALKECLVAEGKEEKKKLLCSLVEIGWSLLTDYDRFVVMKDCSKEIKTIYHRSQDGSKLSRAQENLFKMVWAQFPEICGIETWSELGFFCPENSKYAQELLLLALQLRKDPESRNALMGNFFEDESIDAVNMMLSALTSFVTANAGQKVRFCVSPGVIHALFKTLKFGNVHQFGQGSDAYKAELNKDLPILLCSMPSNREWERYKIRLMLYAVSEDQEMLKRYLKEQSDFSNEAVVSGCACQGETSPVHMGDHHLHNLARAAIDAGNEMVLKKVLDDPRYRVENWIFNSEWLKNMVDNPAMLRLVLEGAKKRMVSGQELFGMKMMFMGVFCKMTGTGDKPVGDFSYVRLLHRLCFYWNLSEEHVASIREMCQQKKVPFFRILDGLKEHIDTMVKKDEEDSKSNLLRERLLDMQKGIRCFRRQVVDKVFLDVAKQQQDVREKFHFAENGDSWDCHCFTPQNG